MMDFANIFIVGTATLLPISFIQRWRVGGNKNHRGILVSYTLPTS